MMDSEEELPDIPYRPVTDGSRDTNGSTLTDGRTVTDGRPVTDGRYVTNKREDTTKVTVNNLRNDSDGRTVTDERPVTSKSREHVPNPLTEGQGVKRSVPLSAEDKKKLAAERKRRYRAARSAAAKEEERARNRARMAMVRHAVKFNLPKPPKKAPVDFSKYFISKQK